MVDDNRSLAEFSLKGLPICQLDSSNQVRFRWMRMVADGGSPRAIHSSSREY